MKPESVKLIERVLAGDDTVSPAEARAVLTAARIGKAADASLTAGEVADLLAVSVRSVWRYVEARELKPFRLSDRILRFDRRDVEQFKRRGKRRTKPVPAPPVHRIEMD